MFNTLKKMSQVRLKLINKTESS